jgi:spore germination cell wall hydrolase CwlJ-like protein
MRTETVKLYTSLATLLFIGYITFNYSAASTTPAPEPVFVYEEPEPTPEPKPVVQKPKIDKQELECLALNIYHEARSESTMGQLAVAHVTLNRVEHGKFPDTICQVVKQARYSIWWKEHHDRNVPIRNKCQFSWYCDGKSDRVHELDAWRRIMHLSLDVMLNKTTDPTSGAIYYYNPELADPFWKDSFQQVAWVDNHVFLR